MNNNRRKLICELSVKIQNIANDLAYIKDEEEDYYNNMPESLQYSARGEQSENAVDCLDNAISSLEEVVNRLDEATQ